MITTLLLAAAPFLGGDNAADSVLARHDLSGVLASFDASRVRESLMYSAGSTYIESERTELDGLYGRADADTIVALLARLFVEEFEYEGRSLALQGDDELMVMAPQEIHAKVRAAIQALEATLAGTVELQVDILSLPGDAPAPFGGLCVVDEAKLGTLPTAGRAHESYRVSLQAGRTATIDRMERLPLLVDYDVEIASGSAIHDPVVRDAEAGTRLFLRGSPTNGGLALSVIYGHGAALQDMPLPIDAPLRSFIGSEKDRESLFLEAPRAMERYEIAFRSAAFDTVLPDGQALVLSSAMSQAATNVDGASRELVVIRRLGGEIPLVHRFKTPGSARELIFVNSEGFHAPETEAWGPTIEERDSHYDKAPNVGASFRTEPSVFLVDWIDRRFSTWRLIGPWVVCVYDPAWDGDASPRLSALVASWGAPSRVMQVEVGGRVAGDAVASWRLPVRAGSQVAGMVGISTTSLADYNVEVAQFVAAGDPVLVPHFSGLAFTGRALALASGAVGLDLDARLNHRRGLPKMIQMGGPMMTRMEKASFDVLRVDERVVVDQSLSSAMRVLGEAGGLAKIEVSVR